MALNLPPVWVRLWNDIPRIRLLIGMVAGLLALGLNLGIKGTIALDWQRLYRPEDFHSWSDLWTFMAELQTGISPFWSFLEISAQLILGSTAVFAYGLYPFCIGLNAYLATTLFSGPPVISQPASTSFRFPVQLPMLVGAGLSLVFAVAIRFIHKGNPQLYDVLMPSLILGWLAALQRLRKPALTGSARLRMSLIAGLLLSVLELTRTLIFPLLPLLLLLSLLALADAPAPRWTHRLRYGIAFLLPILLLSGSWHLKQMVAHDKLHWSNHDGYNMQKSWAELAGPIPADFIDEPPLYEGGMDNINTDRHTAYNKAVQAQVRKAILQHPGPALGHFGSRLLAFYKPKTDLFLARSPGWFNLVYRPVVWLCALVLFGGLLWTTGRTLRHARQRAAWLRWGRPEVILWVVTWVISCVFAVGEVGEEARFMISLLPLLAAGVPPAMRMLRENPASSKA